MRGVVLGPGGSGKSTFARRLGAATGVAPIGLDALFWGRQSEAMAPDRWIEIQRGLVDGDEWILDGDLGPYDVLDIRLRAADTVVVLDLPTWVCAWRALRRSPEGADFWYWLLRWRRRYRPQLMGTISKYAGLADLYVIGNKQALQRVIIKLATRGFLGPQ